MDDIERALIAVGPLEDAVADAWFAAICQQYAEVAGEDDGWELFVYDLSSELGSIGVSSTAAGAFFDHVESGGGLGMLANIVAIGSALPERYRSAMADTAEPEVATAGYDDPAAPASGEPGYADDQLAVVDDQAPESGTAVVDDTKDWYSYLKVNGASWNGTAEHWPAIRQWLAEDSAAVGFGEPTEAFLLDADKLSIPDRIQLFTDYGVTIVPPVATEPVAADEPSEQAFQPGPNEVSESADVPEPNEVAEPVDVPEPIELTPNATIDVDEVLRALEDDERADAEQDDLDDLADDAPVALDDTVLDDDLQRWVLEMQAELGLAVDGVLGPKTFDALVEYAGDEYQDA